MEGWRTSAVQVTLSPSDARSGVAATYYKVDGGPTQTYSGPFMVDESAVHQVNSALREFLPEGAPLDLDRKKLRAMCWEDARIEFAYFDWVIWDERADLAFFGIHVQDGSDPNFFRTHLLLDHERPEVGAEVGVLGYNDLKVLSFDKEQNKGTISRQLLLRIGRVKAYHPEGHSLIQTACIATTIPIFHGMSGAPVMKFVPGGKKLPFGVMSFDPDTEKRNRSIPGESIVPVIRPVIELSPNGQRSTMLTLDSGIMAGTGWVDDVGSVK